MEKTATLNLRVNPVSERASGVCAVQVRCSDVGSD